MEQSRHKEELSTLEQTLELRRRTISADQMQRFEGYISDILAAFGLDLQTPSAEETPRRFLQALFEATEGYDGDPKLFKVFETECRGEPDCQLGQIIEGPIPFYSLCEHHGFPFFGQAYIGYIPHEHLVGISKLTRLVRLFAKRFSVQERLGEQIISTFETLLAPHGTAVYLEAHHLCVAMRGVRETSPFTHTTFWRGEYATNAALRAEFLLLCNQDPHRSR